MKTCTKCLESKPLFEFPLKSTKTGRLDARCKSCHRANSKRHYSKNPEAYKKRSVQKWYDSIEWLTNFKSQLKCENCGENHIACLDFHHNDPNQKDFAISKMIHRVSKETLLQEIEKCTVLCSNCHRKFHWDQKNKPS